MSSPLWVHKYAPKDLDSLSYHDGLTQTLKSLANGEEFPHLLVYGPSGAGKKTRVNAILRELYGKGAQKIKIDARVVQVTSSRKVEFSVVSSVYHMELTPSDMGNSDRLVIQDLLKEAAQTQQVDPNAKHRFKVVVINEADALTRDAQAALRRTMEKYSPNVRLILLANTTSNIIGPIRSRTLLVRVAAPSIDEVAQVLADVAQKEKDLVVKDEAVFARVAQAAGRNLRRALLMFEAMYAQHGTLTASTPVPPADWEAVISQVADDAVTKRNVQSLLQIRSTFYELISHCIPPPTILKSLAFAIMDRVGPSTAPDVVSLAAFYVRPLLLPSSLPY